MTRFKTSDSQVEVYAESRNRRMLVGTLTWNKALDQFEFDYEKAYLKSPKAIPMGPDLSLSKRHHIHKGKLFASFQDRIPAKNNPAYADYCAAAGISPKERNPIILLGAIGRRGPSNFVIEPKVMDTLDARSLLVEFRQKFKISLHELGMALGLNKITLQRIETGSSKDVSTLRLLGIFFTVSEALENQLRISEKIVHRQTAVALRTFVLENQSR